MAAQMKQDKKTLSEIQKAIDKKFMEQYPFERPTQALLRYRNRLGMVTPNAAKSDDGIKVKPGVAAGTCCKHAMANSEAK
jgi:hypothetical protein